VTHKPNYTFYIFPVAELQKIKIPPLKKFPITVEEKCIYMVLKGKSKIGQFF
jgi:hypothetical protein